MLVTLSFCWYRNVCVIFVMLVTDLNVQVPKSFKQHIVVKIAINTFVTDIDVALL